MYLFLNLAQRLEIKTTIYASIKSSCSTKQSHRANSLIGNKALKALFCSNNRVLITLKITIKLSSLFTDRYPRVIQSLITTKICISSLSKWIISNQKNSHKVIRISNSTKVPSSGFCWEIISILKCSGSEPRISSLAIQVASLSKLIISWKWCRSWPRWART